MPTYPDIYDALGTAHAPGQTISSTEDNKHAGVTNALQAKLGTGATAPATAGHTLVSAGSGASVWRAPAVFDVRVTGAVGNGVANDTAAIQGALDAVDAVGGGTVSLPRGTFLVTAILTGGSHTILQGAGQGATTIKQGNAANLAALVRFTSKAFVAVRDLTLDGNKAQNTTRQVLLSFVTSTDLTIEGVELANTVGGTPVPGIALGFSGLCERVLVQGNYIHDAGTITTAPSDAIYAGGRFYRIVDNLIVSATDTGVVFEAISTTVGDPSDNTIIAHNTVKDTPGGISVDAAIASTYSAGVEVAHNTLEGCSAVNGGSIYVYRSSGTSQAQVVVQGNIIRGATDGHGIFVDQVDDISVVGNLCVGVSPAAGKHGINVQRSNRVGINGNVVSGGGGFGIYLAGVTRSVLQGNLVYDNSKSSAGTYSGIGVGKSGSTESDGVTIVGNQSFGASQGRGLALTDASTNVLVQGNDLRGNNTNPGYLNSSSGNVRRGFNLTNSTADTPEAIDHPLLPNNTSLWGLTSAGVVVNLLKVTNDATNLTRYFPAVDAGGFQWVNQAAGASWMTLVATGLRPTVRLNAGMGVPVASATALALGLDGNLFHVTGATQINLLDATNWLAGARVTLIFDGAPTVKHNQTVSGVNKPILLAGAVDFVASANDTLTLIYDGTTWSETSRAVI